MNLNDNNAILCFFILAVGIILAGAYVGRNIYHSRVDGNFVTVKGLAERDVTADLAVWNINYTATGDVLADVNNEISRDKSLALLFLKNNKVGPDEIEIQPIKVTDLSANPYQNSQPAHRFLIKGGVKVRSTNVQHIRQISQLTSSLIEQGVVLSPGDDSASPNPIYFYTQLNNIRPVMLAEATKSAREVAKQFALDSNSKLGLIHSANQGIFEITSQDDAGVTSPGNDWQAAQNEKASINKKVRLVTTVQYKLSS
ncbi:MAG: hypothetical protein K0S08_558 [Gammaproteobacteria bacterium]|jgi:hypothetical protein|nr:hypothetical protein [Gammaproteobacteria bacterium]